MREYYEVCLREYMDVLKLGEVADFTGYDRITINRWINSGKLKRLKVGNKSSYPSATLSTGCAQGSTTAQKPSPGGTRKY